MNAERQVVNKVRFACILLLLVPLCFNTVTISYFFTTDGRIDQDIVIVLIWVFNLVCTVSSIFLWTIKSQFENSFAHNVGILVNSINKIFRGRVILGNLILLILLLCLVEIIFPSRRLTLPSHQIQENGVAVYHNGKERNEMVEAVMTDLTGYQRKSFQYRVITDHHGARVDEHPTMETRKKNLVLVGDSYMFGEHAEYRESLAGWLDQELPDYNVYNFGVSGSSSFSYAKIVRYFLNRKALQPDLIVIGIMLNLTVGDLPRVLARRKYGEQVYYQGVKMSQIRATQLRNSFWYRFVFFVELNLRRYSTIFNVLYPQRASSQFAIQISSDEVNKYYETYSKIVLGNIKSVQYEIDVAPEDIIILFVIHSEEITREFMIKRGLISKSDKIEYVVETKRFWNRLKRQLQAKHYRVVDPWEPLIKQIETGEFTHAQDGHMVGTGYRVVAREVVKQIQALDAR